MTRTSLFSTALMLAGTAVVLVVTTARSETETLFGPLPTVAADPPDNPTSPAKVALGRALFWDPILSESQNVACATCHHPSFGYTDGRDLPIGVDGVGLGTSRHFASDGPTRFVKRNSPTLLNVAFSGID